MKSFIILSLILLSLQVARGKPHRQTGRDDAINDGFNTGKRCINMWDEGCINGQISGSGRDDDYINGGFNPGKRCVNVWDEGCVNGQLIGSGRDDEYVNGGFNPGKRCIDIWDKACDTHSSGNHHELKKLVNKIPYDLLLKYLKDTHF